MKDCLWSPLQNASFPSKSGQQAQTCFGANFKAVIRLAEEGTRSKYALTLSRLSTWCASQKPLIVLFSQLDVPTLRRWISSWHGAPTTRHNQHQRVITFFYFCIEQGWIKENTAKKIKNVPPDQEETLPFTQEQYDALIEATSTTIAADRRGTARQRIRVASARTSNCSAGAVCAPAMRLVSPVINSATTIPSSFIKRR